jgi:hypothetical protein
MEKIIEWVAGHQPLLQQLGTISLIVLAITVVALPVVVIQLPENYFTAERRGRASRTRKHPFLWAALSLLKNLLGSVLILAGLVMLVLPGQGAVTILIGLALSNFPGKYAIERRIVSQPAVGKTLNRIRELGGAPSLSLPVEAGMR